MTGHAVDLSDRMARYQAPAQGRVADPQEIQSALLTAVAQNTAALRAQLRQVWQAADLADRWGMSQQGVVDFLQSHGFGKGQTRSTLRVPLDVVLGLDDYVRTQARKGVG